MYQFQGELLQTFLEANSQCTAIGIFIEQPLCSRHLITSLQRPSALSTKGQVKVRVCVIWSELSSQFSSLIGASLAWNHSLCAAFYVFLPSQPEVFPEDNLDLQTEFDTLKF
jgi:hypothetical protein